jgi:MoxR-like ATPase
MYGNRRYCVENDQPNITLDDVQKLAANLRTEIGKAIIGQDTTIYLMLVALLTGGHMLLEGVPGTAKTLLAQSVAASLKLQFGRVQFTPDLMPGDMLGTNLFNFQTSTFTLTKGPIFTEFLLADEINRTPPKTQAALLEAMQERRVTIDGTTHTLSENFMVVATQNPIENQGTYPLPEAQLDRFLFKHVLTYPSREEERAIVHRHGQGLAMPKPADLGVTPVADHLTLKAIRGKLASIRLAESILDYIVDIVRATREHSMILHGASPRAATQLAAAVRTYAALQGRDYALPDDVKALLDPALRHRIVLSPTAEVEGVRAESVLAQIIDSIAAPR